MPNPKRRHSAQRRDKRRSHDFITAPQITTCSHCGAATLTHRICPAQQTDYECLAYSDKLDLKIDWK